MTPIPIIKENKEKTMTEQTSAVQDFDPSSSEIGQEQNGRSNHWEIRTQEQDYAYLPEQPTKDTNRYGQRIDLVDITEQPKGRSMFINDNPEVGSNSNRNKQHGFFFTADNCIGCHACEAACAEKNENPAHLAFRSVGYVEGGSYPDYKRMNISMACNHCDDPVCLKGCPTRAYTKHAEYGAVLQDPETCFGCGYCTWVCPYNAPQLDPVKGQVSKCNMCVDRLEVGLKPACVSACVGNALDFGVIENTPDNREQCKTNIPGFPDPKITQPNIRFQQTKSLPSPMTRTDSMPVKYSRDSTGNYKPAVDQKYGKEKYWNFARLNSRENPLVLFTLFAQAAYGVFLLPFLGALLGMPPLVSFVESDMFIPLTIIALLMTAFALLMSVTHLGKPLRFYRGFNNLRYSPMAREGLGLALFSTGCAITALFSLAQNTWIVAIVMQVFSVDIIVLTKDVPLNTLVNASGIFTLISGFVGLFYMNKCYQIKARPFWHHLQTTTSFAGNCLSLGAFISGAIVLSTNLIQGNDLQLLTRIFSGVFVVGMLIEATGLFIHYQQLNKSENEAGAAHYVQCTTFGKTYWFRNMLLAANILTSIGLIVFDMLTIFNNSVLIYWTVLALVNCFTAVISRALFYILVIPTTMPGAFFWKNKAFEQHARDTGLADNVAVGVAPLH